MVLVSTLLEIIASRRARQTLACGLVLLFGLTWLPSSAIAEVRLQGADGHALTLPAPAERVVSLAPDLTELLFAAGAGGTLVGTVAYSDYPAAAKAVPQVGDAFHVDLERMETLKPDLVLVWQGGTPQALVEKLRALDLPVLALGTRELEDIADNLVKLGLATGHVSEGQQAAQDFRKKLEALRSRYGNAAPLRVFYEISAEPLFTVGGPQSISRIIELCGGRNIFADLTELGPAVSLETVLARDPEVIVTGDGEGDAERRLDLWKRWPQLSAVKHGNLFSVSDDFISRATPRLLEGGQQMCQALDKARTRLNPPH